MDHFLRKDPTPFRELQICGKYQALTFITVRDDMEQQLRTILIDGDIAPFIKNKQIQTAQVL